MVRTPGKPRRYESAAQQAMVALLRAAGHLQRELGDACGTHGITSDQYNVLRILRGAPDGLPRYEIGARMINRAPDVTRILDRLDSRGLVGRARAADDRRLSLTRITRAGLALLDRLDPEVLTVHERFAGGLTAADRKELARLCEVLLR
jgi:DNA-binding MarR family transcriptional regulator